MTTLHPSTGRTGRTASLAARLTDRLADAPTGAGVYLLAFYRDGVHIAYGGASPRGRALHYCGWASNIRARLALHIAGEGSRLCRAVARSGYELRLVRVWHGQGRDYERALKNGHNLARVCPICAYALADRGPDRGELDKPGRELHREPDALCSGLYHGVIL